MPPVRHGSAGLSPRELFGRTGEEPGGSSAEAGPSTARLPLDAAVAQRISLASLRAETQQLANDEALARGVRHRWLTWAREEKNAKPRPPQAVPDEAVAKADELFTRVPPAFRFQEHPREIDLFTAREPRHFGNALAKSTASHLLRIDARPPSPRLSRDVAILSIVVYSREVLTRGDLTGDPYLQKYIFYKGFYRAQVIDIRADQTLQHLWDAIVCRSRELPERCADGSFSGRKQRCDVAFAVEGVLYGEGKTPGEDYAALLAEAYSPAAHEADTSLPRLTLGEGKLADVRLDALPLKPDSLHHIIHHGSCEHAWRIEGVRAPRDSDFPITTEGGAGDVDVAMPMTTFLAMETMHRPVVRYERATAPVEAYSTSKCGICTRRPSSLLLNTGQPRRKEPLPEAPADAAQPPQRILGALRVSSLPQTVTLLCHQCWKLICPLGADDPVPEIDPLERGPPLHDHSAQPWAGAHGDGWVVVPVLD